MRKMNETPSEISIAEETDRIIGRSECDDDGTRLVVLAGMHGNEPAGVDALERVFRIIEERSPLTSGGIIGMRANIPALNEGVRYVEEDMNRIWLPRIIDRIQRTPRERLATSERREIKRVLNLIGEFTSVNPRSDRILVDLHSFSAEGHLFAITAPREPHLRLLSGLYIPMVFGIEESLRGAALRFFQDRGYRTMALEGGQHRNALTVDNIVAALLLIMQQAGVIREESLPGISRHREHLRSQTRMLPERSELVYQHMIQPGDRFRMRPGFRNFQPIKEGEWLATDREGRIVAHCDGYLLMPLYQNQGNDGFFIVRRHT